MHTFFMREVSDPFIEKTIYWIYEALYEYEKKIFLVWSSVTISEFS